MTRCFGYVRVSSAKQGEGVSLAEQREAIRRYGARHGLEITEWFEEKETAAKRGRPIFREVLRRLSKGDADALVIHKIDRSARNLRDWADLGDLMDENKIHFAHESLDLNTRGGRLAADIQAVVAADFIRNLSDETRKGHLGRLRQGLYPFRAPIGYRDTSPGTPKSVDPVMGPLVRRAYELYDSGEYSLSTLAEELYRQGLRTGGGGPIRKPRLGAILHDPFYAGIMRLASTGETFKGQHEPIVPRWLFDRVQRRLSGKAVKGPSQHEYLFRQLFRCTHCGRYIVGERQKGRVYYRCHARDCPSKTVREDVIHSRVRMLLGTLRLDQGQCGWLKEGLAANEAERAMRVKSRIAELRRNLGKVRARLAALTNAYVDGEVDQDTYVLAKDKMLADRSRIAESLEGLEKGSAAIQERANRALELAVNALQSYDLGSESEKRDLLRIVSSNRTLDGKELSVDLSFPFSEMASSVCVSEVLPSQDEIRTSPSDTDEPPVRTEEQLHSILETLTDWARRNNLPETAENKKTSV